MNSFVHHISGPLHGRSGTCRSGPRHSPERDGRMRQSTGFPAVSLPGWGHWLGDGDADYLQDQRRIPG